MLAYLLNSNKVLVQSPGLRHCQLQVEGAGCTERHFRADDVG